MSESPLVRQGVLRHEHGLLYLDRYWRLEGQLAADLRARLEQAPPGVDAASLDAGLARVFPDASYAEQRTASRQAATALDHRPDRADRAPARPPPSPACWRCWSSRPSAPATRLPGSR